MIINGSTINHETTQLPERFNLLPESLSFLQESVCRSGYWVHHVEGGPLARKMNSISRKKVNHHQFRLLACNSFTNGVKRGPEQKTSYLYVRYPLTLHVWQVNKPNGMFDWWKLWHSDIFKSMLCWKMTLQTFLVFREGINTNGSRGEYPWTRLFHIWVTISRPIRALEGRIM